MGEAVRAARQLLVVEDNDVEREGLVRLLRDAGFEVREAATGDRALALLRARRPDLILLDMLLPDNKVDGWGFLNYIRQNLEWHTIPIIIVTGLAIASVEWSAAQGALDIVRKPVDADELLSKVGRLCSGPVSESSNA